MTDINFTCVICCKAIYNLVITGFNRVLDLIYGTLAPMFNVQ